jgi:hypothetical protein
VIGGIVVAWASIGLAARVAEMRVRPLRGGVQDRGAVAAV